jgi:predicted transcriptional regulator
MLDLNGGWRHGRQFLGLTAQIVSAHVANNTVPMQQNPTLIREVHRALATVGYMSVGSAKAKPAVEANKSFFADPHSVPP